MSDSQKIIAWTRDTHPARRWSCTCGARQWEPCKTKKGEPVSARFIVHMPRMKKYLQSQRY